MHPSTKITLKIKRDQSGATSSNSPDILENNTNQTPVNLSSSDEENIYNTQNQQLVVYDPSTNAIDPIKPNPTPKQPTKKPLPSVGTFTVQCANCLKWRVIPTNEKYEEIRENIGRDPFTCETAREWRPEISCDDEADIYQDGSRLWAIDKPNIAKTPPGWQRLLRIRGYGCSKFADVYYTPPNSKTKLRSMIDVRKYLESHPEAGVELGQFSFQTPKPLQEDYVRKRPKPASDADNDGLMVDPISWAKPDGNSEIQLVAPPVLAEPISRPEKRSKKPAEPISRPEKRSKKPVEEISQHVSGEEANV